MKKHDDTFIDLVKIRVKSGHGGDGCMSFRREAFVPKGGPNGGDGGQGGDVIVKGNRQLATLLDFKYNPIKKAGNGQPGMGSNCHGKNGKSCMIEVPLGTVIKEYDTGKTLYDVVDETPFVFLKGGKGGRGNTHFASSTRQAPRFCEEGKPGIEMDVVLELKLIADVGLIGFPNAGKSSLLRCVSHAHPKVAPYPFTTLSPSLGTMVFSPAYEIVIADMPGIIEGAHNNVGLGHTFLRHIERTALLVFVIDIAGCDGRDPIQDFTILKKELSLYKSSLSKERYIVAANKIDLIAPEQQEETVLRFSQAIKITRKRIYPISAVTHAGIEELKRGIAQEHIKIKNG